jgi:hypothetical protein
VGGPESIILCGPVGVGKSHIAQALGHLACQKGYRVRHTKIGRLLSDLGGGRAKLEGDCRTSGVTDGCVLVRLSAKPEQLQRQLPAQGEEEVGAAT